MNQILAPVFAIGLTVLLLSLNKRSKKFLFKSTATNTFSKANQSQSELVTSFLASSNELSDFESTPKKAAWKAPNTLQEHISLKKHLQKQMRSGSPDERLQVMHTCQIWGHRSTLPLLRKGLRDCDSRVVLVAARAISKHKAVSPLNRIQEGKPPRNVSLMR